MGGAYGEWTYRGPPGSSRTWQGTALPPATPVGQINTMYIDFPLEGNTPNPKQKKKSLGRRPHIFNLPPLEALEALQTLGGPGDPEGPGGPGVPVQGVYLKEIGCLGVSGCVPRCLECSGRAWLRASCSAASHLKVGIEGVALNPNRK